MKQRLILLAFVTILSLSLSSVSHASTSHSSIETRDAQEKHLTTREIARSQHAVHAARSVTITLKNRTGQTLFRSGPTLDHGIWTILPPETIADHQSPAFESESDGFMTGTEGHIYYWIGNTGKWIWLYWDNPYIGSNSYNQYVSGNGYQINMSGDGSGNNSSVTFIVMDS